MLLLATLLACGQPFTDPALTGVLIRPIAGEHTGPLDLGVLNRTGEPLTCAAWDLDECPAMPPIGTLEPGERWDLEAECVGVDVACWRSSDPTDGVPLRSWTWSVKPDPLL